jgi:cytochrome c biogenesis protein ResB
MLGNPQKFDYAGRSWKLIMRPVRHYQPFSITLEKFSHDIYPGTDIPKNFSSKIRINPEDGGSPREVLIFMNNPLRYAGLTYYQASFDGEHTTILQVVRNPSWLVPYISCGAIALGLVIQFMIHLAGFARKRRGA